MKSKNRSVLFSGTFPISKQLTITTRKQTVSPWDRIRHALDDKVFSHRKSNPSLVYPLTSILIDVCLVVSVVSSNDTSNV